MPALIRRRDFIAGCAAAGWSTGAGAASLVPGHLPIPDGAALRFDVVREGSVIGTHELRFHQAPGTLAVEVVVDLAIGIGPITFFRYRHRALEKWRDGRILSIEAETDDDGDHLQVSGRWQKGGFVVDGSRGRYIAPDGTLPATHWNRQMLNGPMINTETGALMHPHVAQRGIDEAPSRAGAPIRAHHFALTGDAVLDTWYDDGPNWVGLSFKGRDGSLVRYEKH